MGDVALYTFTGLLNAIKEENLSMILLGSKAHKVHLMKEHSLNSLEEMFNHESDDVDVLLTDGSDDSLMRSHGFDVLSYNQAIPSSLKITEQEFKEKYVVKNPVSIDDEIIEIKTPSKEFMFYIRLFVNKLKSPFYDKQPKYLKMIASSGIDSSVLGYLFSKTEGFSDDKEQITRIINHVISRSENNQDALASLSEGNIIRTIYNCKSLEKTDDKKKQHSHPEHYMDILFDLFDSYKEQSENIDDFHRMLRFSEVVASISYHENPFLRIKDITRALYADDPEKISYSFSRFLSVYSQLKEMKTFQENPLSFFAGLYDSRGEEFAEKVTNAFRFVNLLKHEEQKKHLLKYVLKMIDDEEDVNQIINKAGIVSVLIKASSYDGKKEESLISALDYTYHQAMSPLKDSFLNKKIKDISPEEIISEVSLIKAGNYFKGYYERNIDPSQ